VDQKQIEKLMVSMQESRIKRIVIKRQDFEIEIERECAQESIHFLPPPAYAPPPPSYVPSQPAHASKATSEPSTAESSEKTPTLFVTSPMVGTFYASPSPEDPPFVKEGDIINEDTVVCIIEAMKVMNEVKARVKGTVSAVLIRNGEPVEFGTQILRVTPA
jgi:acetyl-CoA carboxylase biotin carboxyl carrier protein